MASNVVSELLPGLTSFPTSAGQTYLFAGISRSGIGDEAISGALSTGGFASVAVYDDAPPGWPRESLPPLSDGERYFRASGVWTLATPAPTSFTAPGGSLVIFEMWIAAPQEGQDAAPAIVPDRPVANYGVVDIPPDDSSNGSSGASSADSDRSLVWPILGVAAAAAVGFYAMNMFAKTPRASRA